MAAHKLQIMRGLVSNLPSLDVGELALTTDTNSVKLWAGTASGNVQVGGPGLKPGSHSHILSGTEITGVLPTSKGGSGLTTAPSLLVNLSSTTATSIFTASPRPGITGTLAVSHGGTGATTATAARKALGALHLAGSGTSEPSDSLGENGDIYIQYV